MGSRRAVDTQRVECQSDPSKLGSSACVELAMPIPACSAGKARCPDGSCRKNCAVQIDDEILRVCGSGMSLCADAITCRDNAKQCSKDVPYNGCDIGLYRCNTG